MEVSAPSDTVIGSAVVVTGADVVLAIGLGRSNSDGVSAIGGSKRARVVNPKESVNNPVHKADHVGSRENISVGGLISGSHGGPIVVITVPLVDVLFPKPQVGQARSLTMSGAKPSAKTSSEPGKSTGSRQISPTVKL